MIECEIFFNHHENPNKRPINKFMPKNEKSFQFRMWILVTHSSFDNFILFLIVLNTISLMVKHFFMSADFEGVLALGNVIFTTLFSIECFLKLYRKSGNQSQSISWMCKNFRPQKFSVRNDGCLLAKLKKRIRSF